MQTEAEIRDRQREGTQNRVAAISFVGVAELQLPSSLYWTCSSSARAGAARWRVAAADTGSAKRAMICQMSVGSAGRGSRAGAASDSGILFENLT